MITREQWELRKQQWAEFNRFKRWEIKPEYPAESVLGFISTVLEWQPDDVRTEERDPERRGVRRMHELLGAISL